MSPDSNKENNTNNIKNYNCEDVNNVNNNLNNNKNLNNTNNSKEICKNTINRELNRSPVSDKSQSISITSLDDDAIYDSSIADSDSDLDIFEKKTQPILNNVLSELNKDSSNLNNNNNSNNLVVLKQNLHENNSIDSQKPKIGSVAVQNSTDITFGDKNFYNGPVVIQKFIYEKNQWKENGEENPNFTVDPDAETSKSYHDRNYQNNNQINETNSPHINSPVSPLKLFIKSHFKLILISITIIVTLAIVFGIIIGLLHTGSYHPDKPVSRLRMISRDEWIAQPPNNPLDEQKLPVKRVIIAHTATEGCETQAKCVFRVRIIQTFHMESKNWDDIGYNFLVGGDGAAYEGRGWDKVGAHTKGFNYGSICIAFIGTFTRVPPVQRQLDVAKLLIEEGLRLKYIDPNYKLQPHRLFYATESPGDQLYNIIKTWPHFNETID